jgi:hypothetical protein
MIVPWGDVQATYIAMNVKMTRQKALAKSDKRDSRDKLDGVHRSRHVAK